MNQSIQNFEHTFLILKEGWYDKCINSSLESIFSDLINVSGDNK